MCSVMDFGKNFRICISEVDNKQNIFNREVMDKILFIYLLSIIQTNGIEPITGKYAC